MASKVDTHFEEYREQTRIKHEILTKYLKPYFTIRATGEHKNLVYIDGFAGCGEYQSESGPQAGSPLRALATFETMNAKGKDVGARITPIFIEIDDDFFPQLKAAVEKYDAKAKGLREPVLIHGTFEAEVEQLLAGLKSKGSSLAPSFLFADPCGVQGLSFGILKRYLSEAQGEALLFFNYDGVTRIAGLGFKPGGTLSQLVGGDERAMDLVARLEGKSPKEKEEIIVGFYKDAFDADVSDLFCTAFRVEYEDKRATSHYLIHLSRNAMGFRLMKEIMWPLGETAEGKGALALEQASILGSRPLFNPEWDDVKTSILDELKGARGPLRAKYFYITLSERRDNVLCRPAYKKALLELESANKIIVLDKDGNATTATTRRKYKGEPTLSEECLVRLVP